MGISFKVLRYKTLKPFNTLNVRAMVLVLFLYAITNLTFASSLQVSPVRIFFEAGQTISSITISNQTDAAVMVQSELVSWRQEDGKPVLEPTEDIIISPPIFDLPGGQSQVVRFALRDKTVPEVETSYRVFLSEVPIQSEAAARPSGASLKVALRLSLPIFVPPRTAVQSMRFALRQECKDNRLSLFMENDGTLHERVLKFNIEDRQTGEELFTSSSIRYLLPGSSGAWPLEGIEKPGARQLQAVVTYLPMRTETIPLSVEQLDCDAVGS